MKILIATDAWKPQVNGVVATLGHLAEQAAGLGAQIQFITPAEFRTLPLPNYPEVRLSLVPPGAMERRLDAIKPDAIHIATEGPVGSAMRRLAARRGLSFTTSFHTRFPEYIAERLPVPRQWSEALVWRWLRDFHGRSAAVMAATPTLAAELTARHFPNVRLWPRGVDATLFRPRETDLGCKRPVFLTVGRLAIEKNLPAFLALDLPGTKVVVGDGPARASLERQFPDAVYLGAQRGERLAEIYAAADVFVFPSRTDTYGLVLLEALASGVPVAAYPVTAPRDVIGTAPIGVLDEDLRRACFDALQFSRADCRAFAETLTWRRSAEAFLSHVTQARQDRLAA